MADTDQETHLQVEGHHCTLTVYDDHVVIERGGVLATLSMLEKTGSKEIPIQDITGVESKGSRIKLHQQGYSTTDSAVERDLNTIERSDTDSEVVRQVIRERKQALSDDANPADEQTDEALETLRQRFAEGEISEEEFERKRQMLK